MIILITGLLVPVYFFNSYLVKKLKPRESLRAFFLYMFCVMALVFFITLMVVWLILELFPVSK